MIGKMKKSSLLYKVDPFIDDAGLMRVGGQLNQPSGPYEMKYAAILPRKA